MPNTRYHCPRCKAYVATFQPRGVQPGQGRRASRAAAIVRTGREVAPPAADSMAPDGGDDDAG